MSPQLATLVYVVFIAAAFYFDRSKEVRTSKALWIPVIWLMINGSRPVSFWFQSGPTIGNEYVEGSPLDAAIFGTLIASGFFVLAGRWKQVQDVLRNNAPILIYVAYCFLSILWSDNPFVTFKRWIKSVGDVVMIIIVLTDSQPAGAIRRLFCRCGYVLIPVSVLFIKYYPELGRSYNPWTWIPMYSGVTTFKNLLGMIVLVCALGILWHFVLTWRDHSPRRWQHLIVQGIVLSQAIWLFFIANSMTSFSCFILAGFVLVMANQGWIVRHKALIHVMVVGVVAVSLIALFFDSSGDMVKQLGRDSSLTGRTAIWHIVIQLSKASPILGAGFENFWMGDRLKTVWDFEKGIQEAHNGYLEVYLNLGWVGVMFLAGIIIAGYRNVIGIYKKNAAFGSIKIAYFVTGLIYSLTEAGFRMMSPVWLGFLLAVLYVPTRRRKKKAETTVYKGEVEHTDLYTPAVVGYKEASEALTTLSRAGSTRF